PFQDVRARSGADLRLCQLLLLRAGLQIGLRHDAGTGAPAIAAHYPCNPAHLLLGRSGIVPTASPRSRAGIFPHMSIVVSKPGTVEDVDFGKGMRHPDPSNGMWLSDTEPPAVDALKLRRERLARLRAWMKTADYGALLLFDPNNQRYATGSRNMFGYFLRN